jgi:hypothetical protein
MKPVLFIAGALAALAASPALAQSAAAVSALPQSNFFDYAAQQRAYPSGEAPKVLQCFNGLGIKAVSRSGQRNLLVQTGNGALYDLRMSKACAAADTAVRITARSGRDPAVCVADTAVLFLKTPDGAKRCHVADVRRLASGQVATR